MQTNKEEKTMNISRTNNYNYRLMLDIIKRKMSEKKVKEIEKSADKGIEKKL